MGGCSVLVLMAMLATAGLAFAVMFFGSLGLFLAAVVVTIVFAALTPRRRAAGKTLGALIAIPLALYAVSLPFLIYSMSTVVVPFAISYTTLDFDDALDAARTGDAEQLIACLEAETFSFDEQAGDTPEALLSVAVGYEREESVEALLGWLEDHDVPIDLSAPLASYDAYDELSDNRCPIIEASDYSASIDVVKVLLEHGADVNAFDPETGWTPLMYACSGSFERYSADKSNSELLGETDEAIDILLGYGADPAMVAVDGTTAWDLYTDHVGDLVATDDPVSSVVGISPEQAEQALDDYREVLALGV